MSLAFNLASIQLLGATYLPKSEDVMSPFHSQHYHTRLSAFPRALALLLGKTRTEKRLCY